MERLIYGNADLYYVDLKEGDTCPNCGKQLRPIPFFGGDLTCANKKLDRSVMDDTNIETKEYGGWVKSWGGYCSHCAESYLTDTGRKLDEVLDGVKKLSIFMIMTIVGFVGMAFTDLLALQLLLFVGMCGLAPYAIITIGSIVNYKTKQEYVEPTQEQLEANLVEACNGRYNRGTVMGLIGKDMFFTPDAALKEK